MRGALLWWMMSACLAAQGTKPNAKPGDYPAHVDLKNVTIAAENFGHSVTSEHGALFAREFIVIDVAVFSTEKQALAFAAAQFTLRINGKKIPLLAQAPGIVASSIKYDDRSQRSSPMGDPNGRNRLPNPPSVDTGDPNVPKQQPAPIEEVLQRSALPEGNQQTVPPFSGFVYFPYSGKMSKIKSLELLYEGAYGEATLRLI